MHSGIKRERETFNKFHRFSFKNKDICALACYYLFMLLHAFPHLDSYPNRQHYQQRNTKVYREKDAVSE